MSILGALLALLRAIPAVAGLVEKLLALKKEQDVRKREKTSVDRISSKDAEVDAAIARAVDGGMLQPPSGTEQQSKADSNAGV